MSEFKKGDKVRIKWVDEEDLSERIKEGVVHEVSRKYGSIYVMINGISYSVYPNQLEKIEPDSEYA